MSYSVYMLRCRDGSLYTGSTPDIDARTAKHNRGEGARYTRARLPVECVYREKCADKSSALRRESAIKALPREKKLSLAAEYAAAYPAVQRKEKIDSDDFSLMAGLESRFYSREEITPPEEALAWYQACPESCLLYTCDSGIAGFINLFPIRRATSEKLESGSFSDSTLTAEEIFIPADGECCDFLLSCIVADPAYAGSGLSMQMVNDALDLWKNVLSGGIRIYLDASTPGGESIARRLGMDLILETERGTLLFRGTVRRFVKEARLRDIRSLC